MAEQKEGFPTAEAVRAYDAKEMRSFLASNAALSDEATEELFKEGLNGALFEELDRPEDYVGVSNHVTLLQARAICKVRGRIFLESDGGPDKVAEGGPKGKRQERGKASKNWTKQKPRKFLKSVGETSYILGHVLPHEIGASSIDEPSREFKALFTSPDYAALEATFIKKVSRFVVGCLNARTNGTMYLGVADEHSHGEKFRHGEVVGIQFQPAHMEALQSRLEENFTREPYLKVWSALRTEKWAIQNCLKALQFVPVVDAAGVTLNPSTFVVELDVEPKAEICQDIIFYLNSEPKSNAAYWGCSEGGEGANGGRGGGKGKQKGKKKKAGGKGGVNSNNAKDVRLYYFRDSSTTKKYDRADMEELRGRVNMAIRRRDNDEKKLSKRIGTLEAKLDNLLSLGRSSGFPNDECLYVLVCDQLDDLSKFRWLNNIQWYAIFDLGERPEAHGGLTSFCQEYKAATIREVSVSTGEELTENGSSKVEEYRLGDKVMHVSCAAAGRNKHYTWYKAIFPGLSSFIHTAFDSSRIESLDRVMVVSIVDSGERQKEMLEILKMFKAVRVTWFTALFEDRQKMDGFLSKEMEGIHNRWHDQTVLCDWGHLSDYMVPKTEKKVFCGHTLPSSQLPVTVDPKVLTYYLNDGLSILVSNQCEDNFVEKTSSEVREYCEKSRKKIFDFIRGQEPDWEVWFFANLSDIPVPTDVSIPPGLVEREVVKKIIADVAELEASETKPVARIAIIHQPGSGATTVGRSVLWKLRSKNRCVMIDGRNYINGMGNVNAAKLERHAELILNLRGLHEDDDVILGKNPMRTCKTVVVLFDNCVTLLAKLLTTLLLRRCERMNVTFEKTMIVMMCIYSSFNTELQCDDTDWRSTTIEKKFIIDQKLSVKEKPLFKNRLQKLSNGGDVSIKDMLSFVILAEDFNKESEYVKRVVQDTIVDMDVVYPQQQKLLLYLAILKYFADCQLPMMHCRSLAFQGMAHVKLCIESRREDSEEVMMQLKTLSPQVTYFTKETKESILVASCTFLEINHHPVAYQLYTMLKASSNLSEKIKAMMGEQAFVGQKFMLDYIHGLFVLILTKRTLTVDPKTKITRKTRFSQLVQQIIKDENKESAIDVLEFAYGDLLRNADNRHRSVVAQSLARLHYEDTGSWESLEKALSWAERAAEHSPEKFTVMDTIGQVYKRMLQHMLDEHKRTKEDGPYMLSECQNIMSIGKKACEKFDEATALHARAEWKRNEWLSNVSGARTSSEKTEEEEIGFEGELESLTKNFALFGIVETNILVLKHLLNTVELKDRENRDNFIKVLVGDKSVPSLAAQFPNNGIPWKEHLAYVMDLYKKTVDSLYKMTRRMPYTDSNENDMEYIASMQRLDNNIDDVIALFGSQNNTWSKKLDKPTVPDHEKMDILRRFLAAGVTNTFGWISRPRLPRAASKLGTHQANLERLVAVSEKSKGALHNIDKVSYLNVAFAFDYHELSRCSLNPELVKRFCVQLVKDSVDFPEPYFFFTMLFWPDLFEDYLTDENFERLNDCIRKLKRLDQDNGDQSRIGIALQQQQPRPLFFIGEDSRGQAKLKSARRYRRFVEIRKTKKFKGQLDESKNVVVSFDQGERRRLTVRNTNLFHRMKPHVKEVTFSLVFTFAGPVACFVGSTDADLELQKIKTMQAKDKGEDRSFVHENF